MVSCVNIHRVKRIAVFCGLGLFLGALPIIDSVLAGRMAVGGLCVAFAAYTIGLGFSFWLLETALERLRGRLHGRVLTAITAAFALVLVLTVGSTAKAYGVYFSGNCGNWLVWSKLSVIGYPIIAGSIVSAAWILRKLRTNCRREVPGLLSSWRMNRLPTSM